MTDRYAVIGNPIAHSKSPQIHAAFARETGEDIDYRAILGPMDGFEDAVRAFRDDGGLGMNVTVPFKLRAFEMADQPSDRARLAGAANVLKFQGGRILADNADGVGLVSDIRDNLAVPVAGRRVLILGAGGATRGVLMPLLEERPELLVIANRTVERAVDLASAFAERGPVRGLGYEALESDGGFDLVINATSAGLSGEALPVSAELFAGAALAYDMVYGKGLTPFLRLARDGGAARVADGVGMLVEQAAESFVWWRGVRPGTRAVIDEMTVPLE